MTCEIRVYPMQGTTTLFHVFLNGLHVRSFETLDQAAGWFRHGGIDPFECMAPLKAKLSEQ